MLAGIVVEQVFGSALAVSATYRGATGDAPVRIIRRHGTADFTFDGAPISAGSTIVRVRRADVPNPAEGDRIDFDGTSFLVQGAPRLSAGGLVWDLGCVPFGPDPGTLAPWEDRSCVYETALAPWVEAL